MRRLIYAGCAVAIILPLLLARAADVPSSKNAAANNVPPGFHIMSAPNEPNTSAHLPPKKAFSSAVDLLWKARGLQAMEKLENKKDEWGKATRKERCEMLVEFAFAEVVASPDITVKKGTGGRSYHLVFNYGDDGLLDVLYTYDDRTDECVAMSIDGLPKHRRITLSASKELADVVLVVNPDDPNEPPIAFHRGNPFMTCAGDPPSQRP